MFGPAKWLAIAIAHAAPSPPAATPVPHPNDPCALPVERPPELRIDVEQTGFFPDIGQQTGEVQLVAPGRTCTTSTCWTVDAPRLQIIYGDLIAHGCNRLQAHAVDTAIRPMYADEHWIRLTWRVGTCTIESTAERTVDDWERWTKCLELTHVVFGSDGQPAGLTGG